MNPTLSLQWHPSLNEGLTPNDVTTGNDSKAWWICNLGHEWEAVIKSRHGGNGCQICANKAVLKGFNDMWTTHPEQARLLANVEDGYKYTYSSNVKVDWICGECDEPIKDKTINKINDRGLKCPICSDGMSIPEKIMYCLLKELQLDFDTQKRFNWLSNRFYDFYVEEYNLIIEMHGRQHYSISQFHNIEEKLKAQQDIDTLKREAALKEGVDFYIEIDASKSDYEYIKSNIMRSELADIIKFENVSWGNVFSNCSKSLNIEVLELWKAGEMVGNIAKTMKMHRGTVRDIVMKFDLAGKCTYDTTRSMRKQVTSKK